MRDTNSYSVTKRGSGGRLITTLAFFAEALHQGDQGQEHGDDDVAGIGDPGGPMTISWPVKRRKARCRKALVTGRVRHCSRLFIG